MIEAVKNTLLKNVNTEWVYLGVILATAFLLRAYQINLPGLYYDEADSINKCRVFMEGTKPSAPTLEIGGKYFPLSGSEYTGATQFYIYCFFRNVTDNPLLHRYINITFALVAIVFSYLLARELLNKKAAFALALFLTFSPAFLFYSRVGMHVIFLRTVFATGIFYFFYKWYKSKNWLYFYLGSFWLGLGITTRLELAWIPITAFLYGITFKRDFIKKLLFKTKGWIHLLISQALFGLGLTPLILYNIVTKLATFRRISKNAGTTVYGHENLDFLSNLATRAKNLITLLDGGSFWETGAGYHNYLMPAAFVGSILFLSTLIIKKRISKEERGKFIGIIFFILVMLSLSTFSITGASNPMHLLVLIPLPYLIILMALEKIPPKLFLLILITLLASDVYVDTLYYKKLKETQGVSVFSSRINELTDYLMGKTEEGKNIYYLDWGFSQSIYALSNGEVTGTETFGYELETPERFKNSWRNLMESSDNLYVFHAKRVEVFKGRFEEFESIATEEGKKIILERQFYEYDNKTSLYQIYSVEDL